MYINLCLPASGMVFVCQWTVLLIHKFYKSNAALVAFAKQKKPKLGILVGVLTIKI